MQALALALLQTDTSQQQQQFNQMGGLIAGMGAVVFLVVIVLAAFAVWLFWRIFTKAGMSGALSLLLLVPGVGGLIVICILAFGKWNVVPVTPQYGSLPPTYPPGTYPPGTYPPSATPPTQF